MVTKLLLVALIVVLFGKRSFGRDFSLQDCMPGGRHNADNVMHVDYASVNPHPIQLPGTFHVNVNVTVLQPIDGSVELRLTLRKIFSTWFGDIAIPLPCINNVGSCYYDFCRLLEPFQRNGRVVCPGPMAEDGFPCTCPFRQGQYSLRNGSFRVSHLNGAWAWLVRGRYRVHAELWDQWSNRKIGCHAMEVSLR